MSKEHHLKYLLLIILWLTTGCKNSFEGKISYQSVFTNKKDNLQWLVLNERLGTSQVMFIKGNKVLTKTNGTFLRSQLYQGSTNRVFTRFNNDSLYWKSCDISDDPPVKYEMVKGTNIDTVLGMHCDIIIVYTKKSKTTYYYNSKYFVDPEMFKQLNYENRYFLYSKIKSLPLKSIYEASDWTLTTTATEAKAQIIENALFDIGDTSKLAPFDHIKFLHP